MEEFEEDEKEQARTNKQSMFTGCEAVHILSKA